MMRKNVFICGVSIALLLAALTLIAGEEKDSGLSVKVYAGGDRSGNELFQGEAFLALVDITENTASRVTGIFAGKEISFQQAKGGKEWFAVCGIDLKMVPGNYTFDIRADFNDRARKVSSLYISVRKKDFPVEYLTLPPEMTELDEATLKRVREDSAAFAGLWNKTSEKGYLEGGFEKPLPGEVTSAFGRRRIINGEPKSPHTGQDLRAAPDEEVAASNGGKVVLVRDCFFSGKSMVIDHGGGIYSMYFHLSDYLVGPGDRVSRGQVIGKAGSTGRSTATHLHWGFRVLGARVDPDSVLALSPLLDDLV